MEALFALNHVTIAPHSKWRVQCLGQAQQSVLVVFLLLIINVIGLNPPPGINREKMGNINAKGLNSWTPVNVDELVEWASSAYTLYASRNKWRLWIRFNGTYYITYNGEMYAESNNPKEIVDKYNEMIDEII